VVKKKKNNEKEKYLSGQSTPHTKLAVKSAAYRNTPKT